MRVPVLHGRRNLTFDEVPDPSPRPGEVVARVELCGICGSDVHLYDSPMAPDGLVMGHEFGAAVVEVGQGVTAWRPGDRVVAAMVEPCGNCVFCRKGEPDLCHQQYRLQMQRAGIVGSLADSLGGGGYAPLVRIAEPRLMRLPDALNDRQAASVEPAAVGFHAVRNSGLQLGDRVAVLGAGPIGLFTLQCALAAGARRAVVAEPVEARARVARQLGADDVFDPGSAGELAVAVADRLGGPPDVVFDAAGVRATLQQAVEVVRPGGYVMMVGVSFDDAPIRPLFWVVKRVTVRAAFAYSRADYAATIAMLERGTVKVEPLISGVVPASQTAEAFERLLSPNAGVKVLVDPHR